MQRSSSDGALAVDDGAEDDRGSVATSVDVESDMGAIDGGKVFARVVR